MKKHKLIPILIMAMATWLIPATDTIQVKTADYMADVTDNGTTILMNAATAKVIHLPSLTSANIGYTLKVIKYGAGDLKIQAGLADYIANSTVGGYVQNVTASETYATIDLVLGAVNKWQIKAGIGTWVSDVGPLTYVTTGSPTFTAVTATGAVTGATLSGTTSVNGAMIKLSSDAALAADGVITTAIPTGASGIVIVKEATAGDQYFALSLTTIGTALVTNASYTATKDNATTINVYCEGGFVKLQNKTVSAVNVKIGFIGFN